ncbi:hypothetical protein AU375_01586 [Methylobacterium radiotolerans]|nr:hypothetical protein AU375_01586 [Methylobacterium radiotolerans]
MPQLGELREPKARQPGLRGVGLPDRSEVAVGERQHHEVAGLLPEIHGRLALVEGHGIDAHEMHRGGP